MRKIGRAADCGTNQRWMSATMTTYAELLAALRQLLAVPELYVGDDGMDQRTVAAIQRAERAIRNADKSRED